MRKSTFVALAALSLIWPAGCLRAEGAPREGDGDGSGERLSVLRRDGSEGGALGMRGMPGRQPATAQDRPEGQADGQRRPEDRPGEQIAVDQRRAGGDPGAPEAEPDRVSLVRRPPLVLAAEQRTRIQETLRGIGVVPVHVGFEVGIGVVVPRTVALRPLPSMILSIVPGYAGFDFFEVPGQLAIVDPGTLTIVEILIL